MNKILKSSGLILMLLLLMTSLTLGQASRTVAVGNMQHTIGEQIDFLHLNWPIGETELTKAMSGDDSPTGVTFGHKETWVDGNNVSWDVRITQAVSEKFTDLVNVTIPVDDAFKRTFRHPAPNKSVDGRSWASTQDLGDASDVNIPADVVGYAKWNTWSNIDVERWTYSFADKAYDDFVIVEWVFTNISGESRDDTYFSIQAQFNTTSHYPADLWSDYYGVNYKTGEDDLRLYYMWDADNLSTPEDDKANPDAAWGNFQEPQFMGIGILHADTAPDDETDNPAFPFKAGWSQREQLPNLSEDPHTRIYNFLQDPWDQANPNLTTDETGYFRFLNWDTFDEHVSDPLTEQSKAATLSFGPYQMANGQDVRIVTVYAGGAISNRLCIDVGRAYDSKYVQLQDNLRPLPYDIPGFATAGQMVDTATKDAIINTGIDSLFNTVRMVKEMMAGSTVKMGEGSFGIDLAPPSPSLEVNSSPGQIDLVWGNEADGYSDLKGYRIYRSYWRRPELTTPTDTTFVLVDEVGADVHSFVDQGATTPGQPVIRGESYYYYVTAVTNGGLESSAFQNRTGLNKSGADKLAEAASPTRPPDANWKDAIVVVPNPYHVRAFDKYSGRQLKFLNLPPYASIHIYTMTGDLVFTIDHTTGTGDASWDRQDTFSTMEIVSGVYIYVVEELGAPMGSATGEITMGKFVVVK
jgi:hypothetical protein